MHNLYNSVSLKIKIFTIFFLPFHFLVMYKTFGFTIAKKISAFQKTCEERINSSVNLLDINT